MKSAIVIVIYSLLALTLPASADDSAKVERTTGRGWVKFVVPLTDDEHQLSVSFDFGVTKGFLGPSSNPSDQSGFSNADQSIVGVNHQPVTKSSYVHLFLTNPDGDLTYLKGVNGRISRLLDGKWAENAKYFLRIESIIGRVISLQTVDFSTSEREYLNLSVTVSPEGTFSLLK